MQLDENAVYIFNPAYRIRNDIHRVVIYSSSKPNKLSNQNWESYLHPLLARIFCFFTYNRTLGVTLSLLGQYLKRDEQTIKGIISPFIENSQSVYTLFNDNKVIIPKNVIVNIKHLGGELYFQNLNPAHFDCQSSLIDVTTRRMYGGPLQLTIMLNNTCVTNCVYCYADTKTKITKAISTERIKELIDEAYAMKVRAINLMGGEVFLHSDWVEILKKIVDLQIQPDYISTKYPISNQIIQMLNYTGYSNPIQISLDALSPDIIQRTLHVNGKYLSKMMDGIKLMDNSGLKYRISTVLTKSNTNNEVIHDLYRFISSLKNITDWRITPAVNSTCIKYEQFKEVKSTKNDIEALYRFIEKEIKPYASIPILLNYAAINREFHYCKTGSRDFKGVRCSALNNHLFILPDGKATICEQLYWHPKFITGDVSSSSIAEVWNSPEALRLLNLKRDDIQDDSPCKACKLFETCFSEQNRCWVDIVKAYGNDNWDFPDPRCAYAPQMNNDLNFQ
jgi:radical SAM protein with 4Fe4S-binding SPASM domain